MSETIEKHLRKIGFSNELYELLDYQQEQLERLKVVLVDKIEHAISNLAKFLASIRHELSENNVNGG